jgi:hypothetical protein
MTTLRLHTTRPRVTARFERGPERVTPRAAPSERDGDIIRQEHRRTSQPGGRRAGRRGIGLVVATAVVLALLGTVAYAAVKPADDDVFRQLARSGRVHIKNSLGNDALVGMRGMLPGDSTSGTVQIGNASKVRARFYLGLSRLTETPGSGGGRLSYRLVLTVKRLSTRHRPILVYTGPLRQMPMLKLGVFKPRESRIYRFTVLFPEGGPLLDDQYQRASTSLDFDWYARRAR